MKVIRTPGSPRVGLRCEWRTMPVVRHSFTLKITHSMLFNIF
jgi:hypothetical protein